MIAQAEKRKGQTTVLKRRTHCNKCGTLIMWVELKDGRREAFDCSPIPNPSQKGKGVKPSRIEYTATNFHICR